MHLWGILIMMELLVNSKYSMKLTELAYGISNVDSTILITVESGVGKDVFCRLIHKYYNKNKPYIKISCGAIPENLMESELFGYEPGSFTEASKHGKKGVFETTQVEKYDLPRRYRKNIRNDML